jgi:sulfide:quinone oxidoreductase
MNQNLQKSGEKKRIVIIGAGFGGLRFLYDLKRTIGKQFAVTLIDLRTTSLEKPSLVEVALAGKLVNHAQIPIDKIARKQNVEFINSRVDKIFAEKNTVQLENGKFVEYDYLVIATGAVKDYGAIPGFEEFAYSVCDDEHAPKMWDAINNFKGGNVVIGASKTIWDEKSTEIMLDAPCEGPIGEIMFMLDFFLSERDLREITSITVFTPGKVFFDDVGPKIHEKVGSIISKKGIKVITEKVLEKIGEKSVFFQDGTELPSDLTLVIPPYAGPKVIKDSSLRDDYGFIKTDREMRHTQYHNVFVVGDCNSLSMPKLGHIAVLQADVAVSSLMKEVSGVGDVIEFKPEVFCIMNRGGIDATLILSDTLFGGHVDRTVNGPLAHLMKWGFDSYSYYTHGRLPPELVQSTMEKMLKVLA